MPPDSPTIDVPSLPPRGGSLCDLEQSEDLVEEASEESFPASDPPSFNRSTTSTRNPAAREADVPRPTRYR
jgi:hypothetical protein